MAERRRGIAATVSNPRKSRLFVYGSLMRGEANHRVLGPDAVYLGVARSARRYQLVDLGEYPALLSDGECSIVGELYEIDGRTLRRLDRFEGHPHLYRRARLELDSGEIVVGYFAAAEALAPGPHPVIACGDWRARPR